MKGVYVGRFNEKQIANHEERSAIEKVKQETGLRYVNTKFVKKGKKIVAMDYWVCSLEECEDFK